MTRKDLDSPSLVMECESEDLTPEQKVSLTGFVFFNLEFK